MDKMILTSLAKSAKYTSPNQLAWSALYFDLNIIQFFCWDSYLLYSFETSKFEYE